MAKITYTNKVALNENPEIADINKVTDDDMNEIKQVVNDNYDHYIEIQPTTPTDSDCKLFINPNESVNVYGNYISNSYGTSQEIGYSQEYVNGIIESGSNANGNYIKFANGILINMKTISGATAATLWENNIYYKDISNGNWAYPFNTIINCQATNVTNQYWCCLCDELTLTSAGRTRIVRASAGSNESSNYKINIMAIGTWN